MNYLKRDIYRYHIHNNALCQYLNHVVDVLPSSYNMSQLWNNCLPCKCIVFWIVWYTKKLTWGAWRSMLKKLIAVTVIKTNLERGGNLGKKTMLLYVAPSSRIPFFPKIIYLKRLQERNKICWSFINRSWILSELPFFFTPLPIKNVFLAKPLGSFYELSRTGK